MYFQVEVHYYSNEANRNKYKNLQLIPSTKNNLILKIAEEQIVKDIVLATITCHTLLLGLVVAWKYIFQVQVMFAWARYKSLSIYISIEYM